MDQYFLTDQQQHQIRNRLRHKNNVLESPPNHPRLPRPPVCGKIVFHETGPWCQKDRNKYILSHCYFQPATGS